MNRTVKIQAALIGSLLLAAVLLATFGFATGVFANPLQFTNTTQTASATTSISYLTPGTATTTLVHDTFTSATGNNFANDLTELLVRFKASSTASQLNINLEYSNGFPGADCVTTPSACDWYEDTGSNMKGYATTSLPVHLAYIPQYVWKFASSTVGQQSPAASVDWATRALAINVPTRYVRAVFTCAIGGAGCGVWAQFVPAKEVR